MSPVTWMPDPAEISYLEIERATSRRTQLDGALAQVTHSRAALRDALTISDLRERYESLLAVAATLNTIASAITGTYQRRFLGRKVPWSVAMHLQMADAAAGRARMAFLHAQSSWRHPFQAGYELGMAPPEIADALDHLEQAGRHAR